MYSFDLIENTLRLYCVSLFSMSLVQGVGANGCVFIRASVALFLDDPYWL